MKQLIAIIVIGFLTCRAHAGFFGQELQADWRFPEFDTVLETHTFIVSGDVELFFGDIQNSPNLAIDVEDSSIRFLRRKCDDGCRWVDEDFNGWWFHDINNTVPRIIGVTFEHSGNVEGLEQSDLFFDNNGVWANFAGITTTGDDYWIQLNVEFIPAPAALALFAFAGFASRRRKRN